MSLGQFTRRFARHAPALRGAILSASLALAFTACGKRGGTNAWSAPAEAAPAASANVVPAAPGSPVGPRVSRLAPQPATPSPPTAGLRFIAYNVENWLTMDRYTGQKLRKQSPKPAAEKQATVRILATNAPDVIGLCEIGTTTDLAEIQQTLKASGLDLPYAQYTGGSDPVRHLGLLSRWPLTLPEHPAAIEYTMHGRTFAINRGILDAALQTHGKTYRFLGVHLKSKREIEEADQEEMRVQEARLLRRQVDAILQADPQARLVVYGDFNDTRPSPTFKIITRGYNDPGYLMAMPLKDSRGEAWTHYWAPHDIYSRFDFIAVTRALKPEIDFRGSRLVDDLDWNDASDHRPLLAIFR
ncbi:MAG: endonuclease/exonuclease/phosphatase family protein [Verrucomicrobiota bacterium]